MISHLLIFGGFGAIAAAMLVGLSRAAARPALYPCAGVQLPEGPRQEAREVRQRLLCIYLYAALSLAPMYAGFFWFFDAPKAALGPGLFVVLAMVTLILYRFGRSAIAAVVLVFGFWWGPGWSLLVTGGLSSPMLIWMAPGAFMAGPLLGRRASLVSGGAAVASLLLAAQAPAEVFGAVEMNAGLGQQLLLVMCGATGVALLTFYGYSAAASYETKTDELETRHNDIRRASEKLDRSNADMRRILDSVAQGFISLDASGHIVGQWSASVEKWFVPPKVGLPVWELFEAHDSIIGDSFALAFEDLIADFLPASVILSQMPARLNIEVGADNDRHPVYLEIVVSPLQGSGYLMVITDVSGEREQAATLARQTEIFALVEAACRSRTRLLSFFRQTNEQLAFIASDDRASDVPRLKCVVHTLKGNAGFFGLKTIASLCHSIEDAIQEGVDETDSRRALQDRWTELCDRAAPLLNFEDSALRVEREVMVDLIASANNAGAPAVAESLRYWTTEPVDGAFANLGQQAKTLAGTLGVGTIELLVEPTSLRLDAELWRPFWAELVHIMRNCVGHGFVPMADQGIERAPRLRFSIEEDRTSFTLVIEDNGVGVAWQALRQKGASLGLAHQSHDDLVAVMCTSGASTAVELTETWGRGVGMSAVAAECRRMGGDLQIHSDSGEGTTFRFRFPALAADVLELDRGQEKVA